MADMTITITKPVDATLNAPLPTYNATATVDTPSLTLYGSITQIANQLAQIIKETLH